MKYDQSFYYGTQITNFALQGTSNPNLQKKFASSFSAAGYEADREQGVSEYFEYNEALQCFAYIGVFKNSTNQDSRYPNIDHIFSPENNQEVNIHDPRTYLHYIYPAYRNPRLNPAVLENLQPIDTQDFPENFDNFPDLDSICRFIIQKYRLTVTKLAKLLEIEYNSLFETEKKTIAFYYDNNYAENIYQMAYEMAFFMHMMIPECFSGKITSEFFRMHFPYCVVQKIKNNKLCFIQKDSASFSAGFQKYDLQEDYADFPPDSLYYYLGKIMIENINEKPLTQMQEYLFKLRESVNGEKFFCNNMGLKFQSREALIKAHNGYKDFLVLQQSPKFLSWEEARMDTYLKIKAYCMEYVRHLERFGYQFEDERPNREQIDQFWKIAASQKTPETRILKYLLSYYISCFKNENDIAKKSEIHSLISGSAESYALVQEDWENILCRDIENIIQEKNNLSVLVDELQNADINSNYKHILFKYIMTKHIMSVLPYVNSTGENVLNYREEIDLAKKIQEFDSEAVSNQEQELIKALDYKIHVSDIIFEINQSTSLLKLSNISIDNLYESDEEIIKAQKEKYSQIINQRLKQKQFENPEEVIMEAVSCGESCGEKYLRCIFEEYIVKLLTDFQWEDKKSQKYDIHANRLKIWLNAFHQIEKYIQVENDFSEIEAKIENNLFFNEIYHEILNTKNLTELLKTAIPQDPELKEEWQKKACEFINNDSVELSDYQQIYENDQFYDSSVKNAVDEYTNLIVEGIQEKDFEKAFWLFSNDTLAEKFLWDSISIEDFDSLYQAYDTYQKESKVPLKLKSNHVTEFCFEIYIYFKEKNLAGFQKFFHPKKISDEKIGNLLQLLAEEFNILDSDWNTMYRCIINKFFEDMSKIDSENMDQLYINFYQIFIQLDYIKEILNDPEKIYALIVPSREQSAQNDVLRIIWSYAFVQCYLEKLEDTENRIKEFIENKNYLSYLVSCYSTNILLSKEEKQELEKKLKEDAGSYSQQLTRRGATEQIPEISQIMKQIGWDYVNGWYSDDMSPEELYAIPLYIIRSDPEKYGEYFVKCVLDPQIEQLNTVCNQSKRAPVQIEECFLEALNNCKESISIIRKRGC